MNGAALSSLKNTGVTGATRGRYRGGIKRAYDRGEKKKPLDSLRISRDS